MCPFRHWSGFPWSQNAELIGVDGDTGVQMLFNRTWLMFFTAHPDVEHGVEIVGCFRLILRSLNPKLRLGMS